jgi:hypothetical protein
VSSAEELELELLELEAEGGVMGVVGSSGKGKASWVDFLAAGAGAGVSGVVVVGIVGSWPGKGNFSAALGCLVGVEGFVPQGLGCGATVQGAGSPEGAVVWAWVGAQVRAAARRMVARLCGEDICFLV